MSLMGSKDVNVDVIKPQIWFLKIKVCLVLFLNVVFVFIYNIGMINFYKNENELGSLFYMISENENNKNMFGNMCKNNIIKKLN